tara:strand:+ start:2358 stop:3344 length:987 start_codon:yes stop_codon:yes gene_type:complete
LHIPFINTASKKGTEIVLFQNWPKIALFVFALIFASCAKAQTPFMPTGSLAQSASTNLNLSVLNREEPLNRFKKQALQRVAISSGYFSDNDNSSRHRWFSTEIGTGIPLGSFENILATSISYRNDVLSVATSDFKRSDLHELSASLFFRKPLTDKSNLLINIRPGYLGDFDASSNTFGMFGMALITKKLEAHDLTLSYGIVHLNQVTAGLLPGLGLRWEPKAEMTVDLRVPESKISWRLGKNGRFSEHWLHASLGFAGNRWGIRKPDGNEAEIRLKYWSAGLALEKKVDGGGGWWIDLSHQFARRFLESGETDLKLSNGFQISAEFAY